jgi:hypothetical protein
MFGEEPESMKIPRTKSATVSHPFRIFSLKERGKDGARNLMPCGQTDCHVGVLLCGIPIFGG